MKRTTINKHGVQLSLWQDMECSDHISVNGQLGDIVVLFFKNFLRNPKLILIMTVWISTSSALIKGSSYPTLSTIFVNFLMPFNWSKVAYQSIFNLYFPDDYWCWLLFKVSFDHLYPYFEKFISPLINYQFCLLAIYVLNFF